MLLRLISVRTIYRDKPTKATFCHVIYDSVPSFLSGDCMSTEMGDQMGMASLSESRASNKGNPG